jgi:hypothetical protein
MGVGTDKVVTAAIVCIMVRRRSSNGRPSHAGSSFVNFPDDPKATKKNRIAKFGYLGDENNQIFGYLVIWVFSFSGHPNNQIFGYLVFWFFGSPE